MRMVIVSFLQFESNTAEYSDNLYDTPCSGWNCLKLKLFDIDHTTFYMNTNKLTLHLIVCNRSRKATQFNDNKSLVFFKFHSQVMVMDM